MARSFWLAVEVGDDDECWPWKLARTKSGYGIVSIHGSQRGAHRAAWETMNGKIPKGLQVCHRCDNRACCNPAHLFLGSALDNMRDKIAKGRARYVAPRGELNGLSKISDAAVPCIIERHASGESQSSIARELRVHPSTIHSIVRRKHRTAVGYTHA